MINKKVAECDSALLPDGSTWPNISFVELPPMCNADYRGIIDYLSKLPKPEEKHIDNYKNP